LKQVTDNPEIRAREKQFFLEAALLLGRYCIELQDLDQAYEVFQDLASIFPNHGLARFCLGEILFLRNEFARAKEELEKSLLLPTEVGLFPVNLGKMRFYRYYMLGRCFMESGETGKAREMFQKSMNLHRDHYKSWEALVSWPYERGILPTLL